MPEPDFRSTDPYLRARYGISNSRYPARTLLVVVYILGVLALALWSGLHHATTDIRYQLISFNTISDSQIDIRFSVNFPTSSKSYQCTVVARDFNANIVGEKVLEFPSGVLNQNITTQIPTRLRAVNAGILGCQSR